MKAEKYWPPTAKQLRLITEWCTLRRLPLPDPMPATQHQATRLLNHIKPAAEVAGQHKPRKDG